MTADQEKEEKEKQRKKGKSGEGIARPREEWEGARGGENMENDRLLEVQLSREEVRILHQALNNALEFVPAGDFHAVMGVGPEAVHPLMLKLALAIDPKPQPSSANHPRA